MYFKIARKTCDKICMWVLRVLHFKKRSVKDLFDDFFFLIYFTKAYVVDTHLNCINNICFYKEVDKKAKSTLAVI